MDSMSASWLKAFPTHCLSSGLYSKFGPDKAVQCSVLKDSAVHSLHCTSRQNSEVYLNIVQCFSVQCNLQRYIALQCYSVQCNTVQYITGQYSAVQCSSMPTVQQRPQGPQGQYIWINAYIHQLTKQRTKTTLCLPTIQLKEINYI